MFFLQDDESINKITSPTATTPTATTPTADVVVAIEVHITDEDNKAEQQLEPEEAVAEEDGGSENRGHERPNSLEMFDLLTRLQSSRLDDQRCPMPSSPLMTTTQSTQQQQQQQQQPLPHQQNRILRSEAKTRCLLV